MGIPDALHGSSFRARATANMRLAHRGTPVIGIRRCSLRVAPCGQRVGKPAATGRVGRPGPAGQSLVSQPEPSESESTASLPVSLRVGYAAELSHRSRPRVVRRWRQVDEAAAGGPSGILTHCHGRTVTVGPPGLLKYVPVYTGIYRCIYRCILCYPTKISVLV